MGLCDPDLSTLGSGTSPGWQTAGPAAWICLPHANRGRVMAFLAHEGEMKRQLMRERRSQSRWQVVAIALKLIAVFGMFQIGPLQERGITLLPLTQWGFGLDTVTAIWADRYRDACVDGTQGYRWGFFQTRVPCGPE
jgi:hypothetical protein